MPDRAKRMHYTRELARLTYRWAAVRKALLARIRETDELILMGHEALTYCHTDPLARWLADLERGIDALDLADEEADDHAGQHHGPGDPDTTYDRGQSARPAAQAVGAVTAGISPR